MSTADQYRVKAAEFRAKAASETSPAMRAHWESMVLGYLRLADQAVRNSQTDLVYQTPPPRADVAPASNVQQQQQQTQPKTDETPDKS